MLSEISQAEKDRYHMFSSYVNPEKLKRRPWGRGRKKKKEGENQTIRDS